MAQRGFTSPAEQSEGEPEDSWIDDLTSGEEEPSDEIQDDGWDYADPDWDDYFGDGDLDVGHSSRPSRSSKRRRSRGRDGWGSY